MREQPDHSTEAARERWLEIDRVFDAALDLPLAERADFLAERCADDAELLSRVSELLQDASEPDNRLDSPEAGLVRAALDLGDSDPERGDLAPGDHLGRYQILGELGRGGMATVYDAERADGTFHQKVALKLLRRGLDTDEIVRRFLAERQILSGLEHTNIARLIDGGATDDGRPYLVMERVSGEPITEWADRRGLSVGERLKLFSQVADAVQFAHQRLVIHRDLKPSNILVDESGTVKLLDFGIAKLLDDGPTAETDSLTRTGMRPLTPAYASPEQIRGGPVTTASDVYQLGGVLYELLSGRRPFEGRGPELESAITTGRTRPPSEGVDAAARKVLRGDLDAIVLAALRVEPERRYASAADLNDDVRRYLAREPVRARPDSFSYRARRFAGRRPDMVVALALMMTLLSGYVVTLVRSADRLEAERDRAQLETDKAQQVSAMLIDLFAANDPDATGGEEITAFDLLERGEESVDRLAGQPEVQAEMISVIGQMYMMLGRFDRAEPLFRRLVTDLEGAQAVPTVEVADAANRLGDLLQQTGRYAEADSLLLKSIDEARAVDDRALESNGQHSIGFSLLAQGDYEGAEAAFRAGLEIRRELFEAPDLGIAHSLQGLAIAFEEQERFEEAEATYLEALGMMEALDPEHTRMATMLSSLGRLYVGQGRVEEADSVLRASLQMARDRLGPTHVSLGLTLNELGMVSVRRGDMAQGEQYFRESLAIQERALGSAHPEVAVGLNNISYTLIEQGRLEDALPLRRRTLEIALAAIGDSHGNTGQFAFNLGVLLERLDQPDEALVRYEESVDILRRALPDGHFQTTTSLVALGDLLSREGRAAEGEPFLREALADRIALGAVPASIADIQSMLGASLAALGRGAEAREMLETGLRGLEEAMGPDARLTVMARARLEAAGVS